MFKDYYAVLGVCPPSNQAEVKSSYKKQVSKWHPDRCREPNAVEMMQLINEAYFILKDPDSKEIYDAEYYRFLAAKSDDSAVDNEIYEYESEQMQSWAEKAKEFGKSMAQKSLDDAIGLTGSMVSGVIEQVPKIGFVLVIIAALSFCKVNNV